MVSLLKRCLLLAFVGLLHHATTKHAGVRADSSYANNMVCVIMDDGDSLVNMSSINVMGTYFTPPSFASNAFYVRLLRYAPDAARSALQGYIAASSSEADLIKRLNADASMQSYATQIATRNVQRTTTLTLADGSQPGIVRGDMNTKILINYLNNYAGAAKAQILSILANAPAYSLSQLVDTITQAVAQTGGDPQQQWLIISEQLKQPSDQVVQAVGPVPSGAQVGTVVPSFSRIALPQAVSSSAQAVSGSAQAAVGQLASCGCNYPTDLAPLGRLWQDSIIDHFYTTNQAEIANTINDLKYASEGTEGFIAPTAQSCGCGLPLYRSYNPKVYDHFYTTSLIEHNISVNQLGYNDEGITGYCSPVQGGCGATMPLYRFWNANRHDHFYSQNRVNVDMLLKLNNPLGWLPEGITCYVWAAANGTATC